MQYGVYTLTLRGYILTMPSAKTRVIATRVPNELADDIKAIASDRQLRVSTVVGRILMHGVALHQLTSKDADSEQDEE